MRAKQEMLLISVAVFLAFAIVDAEATSPARRERVPKLNVLGWAVGSEGQVYVLLEGVGLVEKGQEVSVPGKSKIWRVKIQELAEGKVTYIVLGATDPTGIAEVRKPLVPVKDSKAPPIDQSLRDPFSPVEPQ